MLKISKMSISEDEARSYAISLAGILYGFFKVWIPEWKNIIKSGKNQTAFSYRKSKFSIISTIVNSFMETNGIYLKPMDAMGLKEVLNSGLIWPASKEFDFQELVDYIEDAIISGEA
jgi:hypothetical protein